jgi:hypothetical protein
VWKENGWRLWTQRHICCVVLNVHAFVRLEPETSGSKEREDNGVASTFLCFHALSSQQASAPQNDQPNQRSGTKSNQYYAVALLILESRNNCSNTIIAHTRPVSFNLDPPFSSILTTTISVLNPSIPSYPSSHPPSNSRKCPILPQ